MKIAIINTNLSPGGKADALVRAFAKACEAVSHEAEIHSLGDMSLPACDGKTCYQNKKCIALTEDLSGADAFVLVSPIYNYDLNAAAKNLIELTGSSWKEKAVGMICLAGGDRSYLAPLGFMNSLGIDYRCLVSPRFVYTNRSDFGPGQDLLAESPAHPRLAFLAYEMGILAQAAKNLTDHKNTQPEN